MKTIYLLLATVLLISCTGADLEKNEGVNDKTIVGTWEYFESTGPFDNNQIIWSPVPDEAKFYIVLNSDGTFQAPGPYSDCDTGTYSLINSTLITAYDCPNGTPRYPTATILSSYDFTITSFESDLMVLSPNWGIIDSSTLEKYRRVQLN